MGPTIIPRGEGRRRAGNISRTTEHNLIKNDPTWPKPVQVSSVLTGYIEAEITAWIEARAAAREGRDPAWSPDDMVPPPQAAPPPPPTQRRRGRARKHAATNSVLTATP